MIFTALGYVSYLPGFLPLIGLLIHPCTGVAVRLRWFFMATYHHLISHTSVHIRLPIVTSPSLLSS